MSNYTQQEYLELVQEINKHNYLYHVQDQPIISDAAFDKLLLTLRAIESEHPDWVISQSPSQRVGSVPVSKFEKVSHPSPILSLANAFNEQDLKDWRERLIRIDSRVATTSYVLEPKIDGLTVVLHYRNGDFVLGATRGNGEIGEDISSNIRTIKSIPMHIPIGNVPISIPEYLVVRGEVYMAISDFELLNEGIIANGEKAYLNPRNTAAGSLRQLDSKITAQRPLRLFSYAIVENSAETIETQWGTLNYLREIGFPVAEESHYCENFDQVLQQIDHWNAMRDSLNFEIDGVVIKINDLVLATDLGFIGKDPRGAIALKFPAREEITKMNAIGVNVGRTGVLTPYAILEPVEIGGVIVKQATLHNFDYIAEKDIREGDRVLVKRAGDVIPYVIGPILETRTGEEQVYSPPKICPVCGQATEKIPGEVALYCVNSACSAQLVRNIEYFVSRSAMDIVGMGIKIVEQLVAAGLLKDVADLYSLRIEDLLQLEGFAQKKAENLIAAIQNSKNQPLSRLITALGIRGVGEVMAVILAKKYKDLDELAVAYEEELMQTEGIGPNIAHEIREWFQRASNLRVLDKLKARGVWPVVEEFNTLPDGQPLAGMTFVVTGTLENFSRTEIKEYIENNGGKVSGSVSKNTDFIVVGDNPGSKAEKARELNVSVLNEQDLMKMVANK